jgi:excisionase family DNA binding protein
MSQKVYSVTELAEKLRVHKNTVRHWIRTGHLNALKLHGVYKITSGELMRFLEAENKKTIQKFHLVN